MSELDPGDTYDEIPVDDRAEPDDLDAEPELEDVDLEAEEGEA